MGLQWENKNHWKWCFSFDLGADKRRYTGQCVPQSNLDYKWTKEYKNKNCNELNKKFSFPNSRDGCIQDECQQMAKTWSGQWICKKERIKSTFWGGIEFDIWCKGKCVR